MSYNLFIVYAETLCDVNKFTKTLQGESNRVKLFCKKLKEKLGAELDKGTRLSQIITTLKRARQKTKLHVAKLENSLRSESSECQRLLQNVETLEGQVLSLKTSRKSMFHCLTSNNLNPIVFMNSNLITSFAYALIMLMCRWTSCAKQGERCASTK